MGKLRRGEWRGYTICQLKTKARIGPQVPPPLSTGVSHTLCHCTKHKSWDSRVGLGLGWYSLRKPQQAPQSWQISLLLPLSPELHLERLNELQGTTITPQNGSYTIGNGFEVTFLCSMMQHFNLGSWSLKSLPGLPFPGSHTDVIMIWHRARGGLWLTSSTGSPCR